MANIVNVGYRSTNYWVISAGRSRLLVDIGWPGALGAMQVNLNRADIPLNELKYALATHYHMDHAGLAEELKRLGVPLLVVDLQLPAIPVMKTWMKPSDQYVEITDEGNVVISCQQSRGVLAEIGLSGQIVHTPGHSDDSISLLLDNGAVFTGDLPPEAYCFDNPTGMQSWRWLREMGAQQVYPAHGPIRSLDSGLQQADSGQV
jgi:ribonuclease/clavin/mitogillin